MNVLDVEQRSLKWHAARLGIPTASRYADIVTMDGKPSKSQDRYMTELLADWLAGKPVDRFEPTQWMERGTETEAEARTSYEIERGVAVEQVGFILAPDGRTGGSPDGLVGTTGIVEIKCPKAATMVKYYRRPEGLRADYFQQVQGYLWLTGRTYAALYAYHADLMSLTVSVDRDDTFIERLVSELAAFCDRLDEERKALEAEGWRMT